MTNEHAYKELEKNALLNILLETEKLANVGGWEWDIVNDIWTFSDNWLSITGCSKRHLKTSELMPIAHPDDRSKIEKAFDSALANAEAYQLEHRILRQDNGETRHVRSLGTVKLDEEGKAVKMYGSAQDITDTVKIQTELRDSELKLSLMAESIDDVFWMSTWGISEMLYVSPNYEKFWGKTRASLNASPQSFIEAIHPNDRSKYIDTIEAFHKKGQAYETEYRIIQQDGRERWIHERGYPLPQSWQGKNIMTGVCSDITERKESEIALKNSETRFKTTFNQYFQFLAILTPEGRVLEVNDFVIEKQGCAREDYLGKFFWDSPAWRDFPEWRERIRKRIIKAQSMNEPLLTEDVYQIADGTTRYASVACNAIRDTNGEVVYILMQANDITARKQAEEALRESEARYRGIVEDVPGLVCRFLPSGEIIFVNKPYCDYFGKNCEELIGTNFLALIPESERQAVMGNITSLAVDSPTQTHEHKVIAPDNSFRWQRWTNRAIFNKAGKAIQYQSIGEDITEHKQLEEKLQQSQKMEAIGNLAGGIAHDFNNILTSIIGFTELALDDTSPGSAQEANLQEVYIAGKRAKDLVWQILTFARQTDEPTKPIRIDAIAKEVLQFIRSSIPSTVEIQYAIESKYFIIGSPTQTHQIIMNICTNAAQAMEETGGILEVAIDDVTVQEGSTKFEDELKPGDYIKIKISDTGVGIPPNVIGSIFEPYYTTKSLGDGTGMGLAVVQGIVEKRGGRITVESQPGKGSVFRVYLPATKKGKVRKLSKPGKLPSGTEKILFVDDEAPIAKLGGQILKKLGYSVSVRTSSIEALELFKNKPNDFDLVISDMTMPNMTGDLLAAEIMTIRPDIPIILCTGYSKRINEQSAKETGIKAFVYKPIIQADLAVTVRKVLDKAEESSEQS